jgi:hypothetical protein
MPTPSFILPTSVPVVDATVEALRVYDGSPAGFDVLPMSFTRASTATRTDSAGNIVSAVPYNIFTYSEQLENILWLKNNITITANADTAPNGLVVADSYLSSVTVGPHPCYQSNVLPSNTYTYSVYVKKVNSRYISLKGAGGRFIWAGVIFDLDTATVVSIQNNNIPGVTGNVSSVGGGWYRISMTATRNFNDFGLQYASSPSNTFGDYGDLVIAGSGVVDYMLWGMQAVVGTEPLPYQETVTRLALPRLDYRNADGTLSSTPRLLLEPQRTNSIRNSTMVGAVAGTPGTAPTNWSTAPSGLTQTIVGVGTENGLPYIDFRFAGTSSGVVVTIQQEGVLTAAASLGQIWTSSIYCKIISAPNPPLSYNIRLREGTSGGSFVADGLLTFVPTSILQKFVYTRTNTGATTAFIQPSIVININNGATYDFTIRIAAPQMELGAYATTFIPTTTAAVTRLVDSFTRSNVFADGLITSTGGTWIIDLSSVLLLTRDNANGVFIGDSTNQNSGNQIIIRSSPTGRLNILVLVSGISSATYEVTTDNCKIAMKWNGTTADVFVNGVKRIIAASFTTTVMQNLVGLAGVPFFINAMALYPTPLSDADCIAKTL